MFLNTTHWKILHQFHVTKQIHLITLPCFAVTLPKHCRFVWGVENNCLIKLNELIDHHTICYTRLESVTFHRIITQHHTTNQVENDGKIPKCFDTAILANFGSLSRGQPHSPNVNHCVFIIFCFRSDWEPHNNEFLKAWDGLQRPTDTQSDWDIGKLMNTKKLKIYKKQYHLL